MAAASSSPTSAAEFGQLDPHTPVSSRGRKGRTSNGKENSRSESLHRRIFGTWSRSRSVPRTSDTGSPKPAKRRKSIVDLLGFRSSSSPSNNERDDLLNTTELPKDSAQDSHGSEFSLHLGHQ